jgi:ABC-type lipoprotein release transport system permease subunit
MNFITYAINGIFVRKSKNIFTYAVLTILVFVLSSVFIVSGAIQKELNSTLASLPDIIVQKVASDKQRDIPNYYLDKILEIPSVENAFSRVWGYYYFDFTKMNFSIIGLDSFEDSYKESLNNISEIFADNFTENSIILGEEVYKIFKKIGYDKIAYFKDSNGKYIKFNITGKFKFPTYLESSDTILMDIDMARKILDVDNNYSTDIVVKISNQNELLNIVNKIKKNFNDVRVITKKDIFLSYQNVFDFKKGFFITLYLIVAIVFFIVIFDRLSGYTGEEIKEIGILRAIGWKISDIIRIKLYESLIIGLLSYISGIALSYFYVYFLKAPLISNIFAGFSNLRPQFILPFYFNLQDVTGIFLLTVIIYIFANIIPAWKISTIDIEETLR